MWCVTVDNFLAWSERLMKSLKPDSSYEMNRGDRQLGIRELWLGMHNVWKPFDG